jgi:hypothetical protein
MCETWSQADVKTHLEANIVGECGLNLIYLAPDSIMNMPVMFQTS